MLNLKLSKQAQKFLLKLLPKHQRQIAKKIQSLRRDPFQNDTKMLKGYESYLRVDSGEYRVIYRVEKNKNLVLVAVIGKRNDGEVYKLFKRKNR